MPGASPLAIKWGLKALQPVVPREIRAAIAILLEAGNTPDEVAKMIRRRFKTGEWDAESEITPHLYKWKLEDWAMVTAMQRKQTRFGMPKEAGKRGRPRSIDSELQKREAAEAAEAEAESIGSDEDAKERLERLRKGIMKRLTIDEQAELLVAQARGDHAQTARGAMAHIIEILGIKAANVPEAPGAGPIFALPENTGPAIR